MNTTIQPKTQNEPSEKGDWREVFLQRILIIAAVTGIFALIPAIQTTDNLITQSIYIGAYVILTGSILIRFPYKIKANIFVLLPLIIGIIELSETGIRGDGLFFFLAYVIFASILIGPRGGLISILVSELVMIMMSILLLNNYIELTNDSVILGSLADWFSATLTHLMVSLVVISGLRMLQAGFDQARARTEEVLSSLRESQTELENRVTERTKELARRTKQMSASTFVAHQTASIQDLNTLLNSTVDLISKQFGYYHVGISLINPRGDYVILQAASSDGGKRLVERGYRMRIGTEGIIGFVAAEKNPRMATNVEDDVFYVKNPELSDTRSELALPLIVRDRVIGVLDMQSTEVQAFHFDEIELFQTLTDQIAVALDNARLLTESQLVISQLETISAGDTRKNWIIETAIKSPAFHYSAVGVRPIQKSNLPDNDKTLTVPLILRGETIGKISLHRKDEFQNWTNQEETVAKEVADQAALALENIRLINHTRRNANVQKALSEVSATVRETLDVDTVLRTSAREIQRALNLEEAEVRLFPQNNRNNGNNSRDDDS